MSNSQKQPIENAAQIIEKFGGIRPMSSKINVAVTTIQGWKKRGVIPATRKELIISAAKEHDIDISEFIGGKVEQIVDAEPVENKQESEKSSTDGKEKMSDSDSPDVESVKTDDDSKNSDDDDKVIEIEEVEKETAKDAESNSVVKIDEFAPKAVKKSSASQSNISNNYTEVEVAIQKRAVNRNIIIVGGLLLVAGAAAIGILKPKYEKFEESQSRISELESELAAMKDEQNTFKGLVPENWNEELAKLKEQASKATHAIGETVESVKAISSDLTTEAGLNKRVEQLQTYVSEITGEDGIYALKGRFDEMRNSIMGEKTLDSSVSALLPIFANSKGSDDSQVNAMIDAARSKNEALQQSLSNVPQNELKAAAMLLAMTQVRSALNRGDEQFYGDLELLKNMIGDDNVELRAAIDKLAPYSKEGVLTPSGLRKEFQSIAGESVAASLRGEDVSFSEKMSAKFNEILKVEKDGELVTGTPTQATLNKADKLIQKDQWPEALKLLRSKLGAKELEPLRPWMKEAEKMVNSRKLDSLLEDAMEANFGAGLLGGAKPLKQAR